MRRPLFHGTGSGEEDQGTVRAAPSLRDPETGEYPSAGYPETGEYPSAGYPETGEYPSTGDADYIPTEESNYNLPEAGAYFPPEMPPVELHLSAPKDYAAGQIVSYDPSEEDYYDPSIANRKLRRSKTETLYEPRKKRSPIKPKSLIFILLVATVVILASYLISTGNYQERLASPLTVKDTQISNADFSFMYHYVLIENGINIFESGAQEQLSAPGEGGFATNRDYFLDMAAREIQVTNILYDDAVSKGYSITDSQRSMAKAYINWLSGKAEAINVNLDTYIKGYFGPYVTQDLIEESLAKRYFTEDYANGPKLDELKASGQQAEDAYITSPNQYDLISYRVLRIVFEQTDESFKSTAHLRAQEIIDRIGHDPSKFEPVAAEYFTGDAKAKILEPDSTLISNVRYSDVSNSEWRTWLFDPARQPGDCMIFDDENGFPILMCFSSRTRQLEPLRDIRFFYVNREDQATGQAGVPANEILPVAQTILDSITDEASVQTLQTTYADDINADKMKAVHDANTYKGVLPEELDSWIFDPARAAGDKTLIETDSQVIILYYAGASANPEWYDRVNSYIRMNNYQAFLLEKGVEYPYEFNKDGLKYIKDVYSA